MASGKPFMTLQDRIDLCKGYTKLWSDFFKTFSEGLEHKKIIRNEEVIFGQMVSLLAFKHYEFTEMMEKYLPDPDGILEVLSEAVSLQHLKELSEAQFSKFQVNWHSQFIAMNKCLGRLIIELPTEKRHERKIAPQPAGKTQVSKEPQKATPAPTPSPTAQVQKQK
jgi:hypothetical protein